MLDQPSIDREDNDGDYTLKNCRFIEMVENIAKDCRKQILQFDLEGNFIKEWSSMVCVSQILEVSQGNISQCCNYKNYKTVGGFKWRFKHD